MIIELPNLKSLSLTHCSNIFISENCCNNLKNLELSECRIPSETVLKFPNIESIELYSMIMGLHHYNKRIDLKVSTKIKYFSGQINDFIFLNDESPLELVELYISLFINLNDIRKGYEKLLSRNTIKKIIFNYLNLDNLILEKGHIENESVSEIEFKIDETFENKYILNNILESFPNLSKLNMDISNYKNHQKTYIIIEENIECKIVYIKLNIYNFNNLIYFYCSKYENLIEIDLSCDGY